MATVVPNLEEAANVATEFIYSIDNLPNEVAHILHEIKHRETRTTELQQEIDKDAARYIRHSRRSSTSAPVPLTTMSSSGNSTTPVPGSPSASSSRGESIAPGSGTPVPIPTKISASYNEIHELAAEKIALTEKLIELIMRTRAKLDVDISKVRLLQGDPPELVAAQASASLNMKPAGLMALTGVTAASANTTSSASANVESFGAPGRNPALVISESLRNAMATQPQAEARTGISITSSVNSLSASGHVNKKRKTAITTSIKITSASSPAKHRSASPSIAPAQGHAQQKSRLSRQVHPPPTEDEDDMDVDGEGDDDDGEVEDDNDERLYCFCRKQSYGDMIACDNEGGCPYEWFHLACVGLKQPPAEKWYCAVCAKDKGLVSSGTTSSRKGRRK